VNSEKDNRSSTPTTSQARAQQTRKKKWRSRQPTANDQKRRAQREPVNQIKHKVKLLVNEG
jgi:hypothetical protein